MNNSYARSQKVLHWLLAVLILFWLFVSGELVSSLDGSFRRSNHHLIADDCAFSSASEKSGGSTIELETLGTEVGFDNAQVLLPSRLAHGVEWHSSGHGF